ncbi:MAG: chemotaxis protein CheA [Pseudolabrys sp.]|nr:chemotaxis protein CheA [Pseudolabrys sp.]
MNELQQQFVTEARELVRQATDDLISLERDSTSAAHIDRVFRAFHTLKGSAGVVELPAMTLLLHAAEDLLTAVRGGSVAANGEIVDLSLACLDQVSRWVDDFEEAAALPADAGEAARSMAERLRTFLPADNAAVVAPAPKVTAPVAKGETADWVVRLLDRSRDKIAEHLRSGTTTLHSIAYEPIPGCFFNGDDPLELMRQVPGLLAFHIEPREPFPPLAELDPYACNLRLQAIAASERDDIFKIFRMVPDQVRIATVPESALPSAPVSAKPAQDASLIHIVLEAQLELLRVTDKPEGLAGRIGAARRTALNALRSGGLTSIADAVERNDAVSDAIEQALAGLTTSTAPDTPRTDTGDRPAERMLRVSEDKIEALVNLAGELIVAKNALAHSVKATGGTGDAALRRDQDAIDRLVIELHGSILQLRMISVAQVFRSFPRLIRDVARQLNKTVNLVTQGENTEADKTIVDRLFEPMVHLVRNAVDHGIETPEQRSAAGKPEQATITIAASRAGDRFHVDVHDDGRGIDPSAIRRRAADKQLLPADELAALTDEHVIDLIFAAGFSTAETISDVSGRGIGMDVVRTAVERMGGRVTLASKVGAGTSVRLDMPMTISMSRIMVVQAGGQSFGISMDAVSETVRLSPDRINRIKNNEGFVLRDQVVPVVSLAELMRLPVNPAAASRLFLIAESGGRTAAFEIDAIGERLEVVLKPMQGLLSGARGYAGTTLLGNGQVLLVLDVKEIMP